LLEVLKKMTKGSVRISAFGKGNEHGISNREAWGLTSPIGRLFKPY
jgi:hypothetical protein